MDAVGPVLDAVDAIVLAPGRDIEPLRYGQDPLDLLAATAPQRDAFELAGHPSDPGWAVWKEVEAASVAGLPVPPHPRHEIEIEPSSLLAGALGTTTIEVSSFHHQAIDQVGSGLEVVARSVGDGLPEAVELPGRPVLAVQWELQEEWRVDPRFAQVFSWFVDAARSRSRG